MLVNELYDKDEDGFLSGSDERNFLVNREEINKGEIEITVSSSGNEEVGFELRGFNLTNDEPVKKVKSGNSRKKVIWKVRVASPDKPWVAVVVQNGDLSTMQEIHSVF